MCEIRAKSFLEETPMCTQSSLVCACLTACVYAHSLEGTLAITADVKTCWPQE